MPTPGSATRSRWASSSTGSGSTAGPEEKLNTRLMVVGICVRFVPKDDFRGGRRDSFGSNQVLLGGMMAPASQTAIRSDTRTGNSENATAARPELTACSSAAAPRAPPTKSIRLSERTSAIFSTGPSRPSCSTLTSSDATASDGSGGVRARSVRHAPCRYMAMSPRREGIACPGSTMKDSPTAARHCSGERPARSFTTRLYASTCNWSCGKATASTVSHSPPPEAFAARNCARARAALAAR